MALTKTPIELSSTPSIVDGGNATAITIDSSENVGIGGAPASLLDVSSTGEVVSTIRSTSTSGAREATLRLNVPSTGGDDPAGRVQFTYGTGYTVAGSIEMSHTLNNMRFLTGTTERMRIDASGKILIGDSASHTSDLLQIETPASGGGHGIQIRRNDSNTDQGVGSITFGNNTATDLASISAKTDGATDNGALLFNTSVSGGANTERLRIDSSGNVGIGVVPPVFGTAYANINIGTTGSLWASKTGTSFTAMSDNNYHNGSGSVARNSGPGSLYYQLSGQHIWANFASVSAGAAQTEVARMRLEAAGDLTLLDGNLVVAAGHGINFSANANASGMTSETLDDYEEGAWTPTVAGCSINVGRAYYTKIGNLVTANFNFTVTATDGSTNPLEIGGKPFAGSSANSESNGPIMIRYVTTIANTINLTLYTYSRTSTIEIYQTLSNYGNWAALTRSQVTANATAFIGSITYETDT